MSCPGVSICGKEGPGESSGITKGPDRSRTNNTLLKYNSLLASVVDPDPVRSAFGSADPRI